MCIETLPLRQPEKLPCMLNLTFESVSSCLVEEVLFVTVVRNMADTFLVDLAQWVDLEIAMLSQKVLIVSSLIWRKVDSTNGLIAF